MTPLAHGRIVIWEGGSLWIFDVPALPAEVSKTDFHAHHAIQVTLALNGAFQLLAPNGLVSGPAAAVAPDARHAFAPKGTVALLFIEPESPAGRAARQALLSDAPVALVDPARLGDYPDRILAAFRTADAGQAALRELGRGLTARLTGGVEADPPDERVDRVVAWAARRLEHPVSIADAARNVGLSPGRMSHLFVEQTGLAFRTYLLWLRLTKAVEAYAAGASLTEAAHGAGFADSAHFSRTFRRMFGVAAANLRLA